MRVLSNRSPIFSPCDVLVALGVAHRETLKRVKRQIIAGSGLTMELAELLIEMFLPEHLDSEGFIGFRDLKEAVGYSAGLLSRRITYLCRHDWTETRRATADVTRGVHGNSQKVRLTQSGRQKIRPLWANYEAMATQLLAGISPQDQAMHHRISRQICDRLNGTQPGLYLDGAAALPNPSPEPEFLD